jgi:single-stranded-DNA-specific exonuclease
MFLCQPLLEVLAGRGIRDIDSFLKVPSWNDLPDPFSIPSMEKAADRVLHAVRRCERITIFGDYDCDGVLGAHILRSVLSGLGAPARTSLPHRDDGYGLSSLAVHRFSCTGTDLLITVDTQASMALAWSRSRNTIELSSRSMKLSESQTRPMG